MELLADRAAEARKIPDPVLERMMEGVHRYEGTVNQVMGVAMTSFKVSLMGAFRVMPFNLLNPTAAHPVVAGFPAQDFGRLLDRCRSARVGAIGIRALAAGALSGVVERHPVAVSQVDPIASGPDYATDVRRAQALRALVAEGHAESLVEAALRFALTHDGMSTVLPGYSDLPHLEYAAAPVNKRPLSAAALARLAAIWSSLAAA